MDFSAVNHLSVLAAAAAAFVVGFLWHGPVFGKLWMSLSGINPDQVKAPEGMWKYLVAAFLQQVVIALVLSLFSAAIGATDVLGVAQVAFWAWLGFIAAVLLNGVLWEKRTVPLYLFNIVYHLVSLLVMSIVIGLWK